MAVVSVTTSLTTLAAGSASRATTAVLVVPNAAIWVSKADTLTANTAATGGIPLAAGQAYEDILESGQALYARTATGTANAAVETGAAD